MNSIPVLISLTSVLLGTGLLPSSAWAQTKEAATTAASPMNPDPNMARPIDGYDSVFLEEFTWLEVRDAMRAGKTTVIIATGGIEQNGPYLALGKHNYILRATTEAIARKLGNALVAPIVPFVPEGIIDPPTGHMRFPGTISVTEETFKQLLTDISTSMKTHGFKHIILIGDSGGNQAGMKAVAADLSSTWARSKSTIHFIPEYYDNPKENVWLETQGVRQVDEGIHDDFATTSQMMTVDPNTVRMTQRMAKKKFSINGVSLAPANKTIKMGKKLVEFRAAETVRAIQKALGE